MLHDGLPADEKELLHPVCPNPLRQIGKSMGTFVTVGIADMDDSHGLLRQELADPFNMHVPFAPYA